MLPWLLSLIIRFFGLHVPLMKIMIITIYLAGLGLFADLMRLKKGAWAAALAVLMTASHHFPIMYSHRLMSELPYPGISLAALWPLAERKIPGDLRHGCRSPPWTSGDSLLAGIAAALIMALGFARRTHLPAVKIYMILYLLVILGWDFSEQRFLLPLYPLLYLLLIAGADSVLTLVLPKTGRSLTAIAATAFVLLNCYFALPRVKKEKVLPGMYLGRNFHFVPTSPAHHDMMQLEAWAGKNLPPSGKFMVNFNADFFLISQRPCVNIYHSGRYQPLYFIFTRRPCVSNFFPAEAHLLEIPTKYHVDYVFIGEAYPVFSDWVKRAMRPRPELFMKLHGVPGSETAIYRFDWSAAGK